MNEKRVICIILWKKPTHVQNNLKMVLQRVENAVECTSIGGDADKNLLINKDLAWWLNF